MRMHFIFLLFLLASCGGGREKKNSPLESASPIKLGQTTKSELLAQRGEDYVEESIPVKNGKILIYEQGDGNVKYQLQNDVVVTEFRDPLGDQKYLIYWQHKFKNCKTQTKDLPHKSDQHTPGEIEYTCEAQGLSVIYTAGSPLISRIVEYAKK